MLESVAPSNQGERITSALEQYSHGEYAGVVEGLKGMVEYVESPLDSDGRKGIKAFDQLIRSQNALVRSLSSLDHWDEQTIGVLRELKSGMLDNLTGESKDKNVGYKKFVAANKGAGPDIWWNGVLAEATFKRLWSQSVYLVTGNERHEYTAKQDYMVDERGIDFMDEVDYEGNHYFVCLQLKSTNQVPAGMLEMIDLTPPNHPTSEEAMDLARFRMSERSVQSMNQTASEIYNNLRLKKYTPAGVRTLLIGIGTATRQGDFSGWEEMMKMADLEETRIYFASKLEEVLSGDKEIGFELPLQGEGSWYKEVFDKEAPPQRRPMQYSDKQAKYEGLARRFKGQG